MLGKPTHTIKELGEATPKIVASDFTYIPKNTHRIRSGYYSSTDLAHLLKQTRFDEEKVEFIAGKME